MGWVTSLLGSIGGGIGSLAKGVAGGAAEGAGLGKIFQPAQVAMKNPITGAMSRVAEPTSTWGQVGEMIGKRAATSTPVGRPGSTPLPSIPTSSSVQRGRAYQAPQKKDRTQTLLEELARMAK